MQKLLWDATWRRLAGVRAAAGRPGRGAGAVARAMAAREAGSVFIRDRWANGVTALAEVLGINILNNLGVNYYLCFF